MNSYIFIVGKSDSLGASAESIRRLGYKVGIFQDKNTSLKQPDIFDRIILVDFTNLEKEIRTFSFEDSPVAGLLCTYENYIVAKSQIGLYLNLPVASVQSAEMSTDKYLMRQAFMRANTSITPRFARVTTADEALAFATATSFPLILKPANLVKSLLVLRCNDRAELLENFAYAQTTIAELYRKYNVHSREPQLVLEEFINGKICSVEAFVDHDGKAHFCEGIVSLTTAQEHGADDNYLYSRRLPLELDAALKDKLFEVSAIGVKALDMRSTAAHIELIYDENSVKIVEIGARIGGYRPRMYSYSYGINMIEQEVRLAIGQLPKLSGTFKNFSAVYELFPTREGMFSSIGGHINQEEYAYYNVKPKPGQTIGPAKQGYKASAVVIVTHHDRQRFDELCQQVDTLTVEVAS